MYSPFKRTLVAVFYCGWAIAGFAQEELFENFLQIDQETNEASENWLQELLAAPLNLNHVSAAELQRLPFLSHTQITAFITRRKSDVYFTHLEQALHAMQVRGDTLAFCRTIFIVTVPKALQIRTPWHTVLRSRTGRPATIEKNWIGSSYRLYHRLQFEYGALHGGVLSERDPGEPRWNDHRVANIMWRHAKGRVILGNFQTEWGLGLAEWSPYAPTLAADVHAATRRWGRGLTPFLSSSENTAYEGAALAQAWHNWNLSVYFSATARDVTLRKNLEAVAYRSSGYHRTAAEVAQRNNLREKTAGAALQYRFGIGREVGVLFQNVRFNRAWQTGNLRESFFDFTGTRNGIVSLAGRWQWMKQTLCFEVAQSRSRGKAAGFTFFQQEGIASWSIALLHVDRNFHSPHGRSLFASDEPAQAQSGYSFGLRMFPLQQVNIELYYQRERNLWCTRAHPLPPRTGSAGAALRWKIAATLRLVLRYAHSRNEDLVQTEGSALQLDNVVRRYRCEFEHRLASRLRLKPRFDAAHKQGAQASFSTAQGWATALSIEAEYSVSSKLTLHFRQTHFHAPHAVYLYERDVPGVFTVVALRESGIRRYIYGHLKLHPNFGLAGKISITDLERVTAPEPPRFAWTVQFDWTRR